MTTEEQWFIRGLAAAAAFCSRDESPCLVYDLIAQHGYRWADVVEAEIPQEDLVSIQNCLGASFLERLGGGEA